MERPKWYESQVEKAREMIKSRDMQFHNLYLQVHDNKRHINKLAELVESITKVIKEREE